ncbi:MAG: energy transducer TonB [Bacteroidota bacterium]
MEQGNCECDLSAYSGQAVVERGKVVDGLKVGQWEGEGDNFNFTEIYDEGHLVSGTMNYAGQKFEYKKSEKSAAPADGMKSFYQNLQKNITYPLKARRKGMQGTVFVQFLVGPGGELTNFRVVKGIGKECDDEAIRAMATSRPWQPGLLRGRPVQQLYILPVIFKLG